MLPTQPVVPDMMFNPAPKKAEAEASPVISTSSLTDKSPVKEWDDAVETENKPVTVRLSETVVVPPLESIEKLRDVGRIERLVTVVLPTVNLEPVTSELLLPTEVVVPPPLPPLYWSVGRIRVTREVSSASF